MKNAFLIRSLFAFALTLALTLVFTLASTAAYAVSINEIRIDQSGSSDTDEYFELAGTPAESLNGVTYLVIGDGTSALGSGVIEAVVDLNLQTIPASGLFTVAEATFTLATADLTASLNFENSDNVTHLLVSGFTGANGDDLDTDDDGTLDSTPWTTIVDSVALIESTSSGELVYSTTIVGPNGSFVPGHIYRCDEGFRIGQFDPITDDTPTEVNDCGGPITDRTIPEIQSSMPASPFEGERVRTTGVVTAVFHEDDELDGFFIQDVAGDGDTTTSDGIFVFDPDLTTAVSVGDTVQVEATVSEFGDLTNLNSVETVTITGTAAFSPTVISLPETVDGELEQYEGMLIDLETEMTVSQNFFLGQFGQMTLSSPDDDGLAGRLYQPTNVFPASSLEAIAMADSNARRALILDDGRTVRNPVPVPYIGAPPPAPIGSPPATVIRPGDTVTKLIGILDYRFDDYRLQPIQPPAFAPVNLREATPPNVRGRLTVASFNVLNFFTTIDTGDICGPTGGGRCSGADTTDELMRQQDKIVAALQAMDADVVGLIELENNGFGIGSSIETLTAALNTALGGDPVYSVLMAPEGVTPGVGSDVITVGFIYKPASVTPIGAVATLETGAFDQTITDGGRSRIPIAASFEEARTGEVFTAVINHFKSKRPPSAVQGNGNDDQDDGQGAWNLRRTEAAEDLAAWLLTDPTGVEDPDVLVIGDLNAYAAEDPILAFAANGYADLIKRFSDDIGYSFTFDGMAGYLDHALANPQMASQVSSTTVWHINTDEPPVLDYNEEFNPLGFYNADPFRSSDHDPVIVGLNLGNEICPIIKTSNNKFVYFCL